MNKKTEKKYFIAILVMLLITFSSFISSADDAVNLISWGDINNDKQVNAQDALLVLKHSARLEIIEEELLKCADVDASETIDAKDALEILKYAAGIIETFPVEELITPEPIITEAPTATPVPTPLPVFEGKTIEVVNLNDVAVADNGVLTFTEPNKTYDGVEMKNPFVGEDVSEGVTISFKLKPAASYFAIKNSYTPVLVFVNTATKEMLQIDAEGTYWYSDDLNYFRSSSAQYAVSKGNEYFITCVISSNGVKYYSDGKQVKSVSSKGRNESVAYEKALSLISNPDTSLFLGGNDGVYFMAAASRHDIEAGTTVRELEYFDYAMSADEIYSLYKVRTYDESLEMPEDFSGDLWIIGDSIAAYHEKDATVRPLYGWGEVIGEYFSDGVRVFNMGISSQSTSSYYSIRRPIYDYIFSRIDKNDYVIISFGHNDHNGAILEDFNRITAPLAATDTEYSFKWWLKNYYIDPVLERGGVPILMSAVVRWNYSAGNFSEDYIHLQYGTAMEELVAEYAEQGIKIYYIDAQDYTYELYSSMSELDAKLLHGQYGAEAGNFFDNTHYSESGARMITDYILSELKKTDLSIKDFIIE